MTDVIPTTDSIPERQTALPEGVGNNPDILAGTRLLTADELADRLGLSKSHGRRTIGNWMRDGRISAIKLKGRRYRFSWPQVIAQLNASQK